MGMRADVLAIGPAKVLLKWGVQDYPNDFYDDVSGDAIILGTVAGAWTSDQSRLLADICGVGAWDLANHRISNPQIPLDATDVIGDQEARWIYDCLCALLCEGVQLYYRPNG